MTKDSLKEIQTEDNNVGTSERDSGRPDTPLTSSQLFGNHVSVKNDQDLIRTRSWPKRFKRQW